VSDYDEIEMVRIRIKLHLPHRIDSVWAELTDWEANSNWIPQTRVTVTNQTLGAGTEFVGVSKVGPIVLEDRMRVCNWSPPVEGKAAARVSKLGPVLFGDAGFELTADGEGTSLVWFENVNLKWQLITAVMKPVLTPIAWLLFRTALARFAKTLEVKPAG